ncbi:FKBP-type peptidyl-prolyl cis-trans isomerase [Methanoculleus oceani]|uniref:Peptidyl-prolyl cis-trans isomerase n=1 Tax=Methanoculleus oceani TaxID=2184756 RepID=A0ABD4TEF2_9EURY|nr:peptidylprolyl isomerase [Methanoculleus sp. CWC-02]MCM2465782.1 peptidylprolyl isomerase [Methanoculleus sp. CWC-02]
MRQGYVHGILLLIACVLVFCSGCTGNVGEQARVKPGDRVLVHYTGTLENGTVFDSSLGGEPLGFTVGSGAVVPGFDAGVVGMQVGEEKTLHIPADQAYGPYREDLVFAVDPAGIFGAENLTVGEPVGITLQNGQVLPGTITGISPDAVTIDANHRLAGEDLTFTVSLVEIV